MQRQLLFSGSTGLNNIVDPVRHEYIDKVGVNVLAIAKNVEHDFTGRVSRRKGWTYTTVTGNCHSLFCDGGMCLFVTGNALTLLAHDMSTTALRNVTVGARMSYAQVNDRVYYTNGREKGYVSANLSRGWTRPSTVHGVKDTTLMLSGPPTGSLLEYFKGRMYVIQMNVAWASEAYDVNTYNLVKNFVNFESPITMFKGVTQGVWVGTRNRIVFLRGTSLGEFTYEVKGLFGSFPGTEVKVDNFKIGDGNISEVGVLFATKYGACLGTSDGKLIPLTDRKLSVPYTLKGSGTVINSKYIFSLEP